MAPRATTAAARRSACSRSRSVRARRGRRHRQARRKPRPRPAWRPARRFTAGLRRCPSPGTNVRVAARARSTRPARRPLAGGDARSSRRRPAAHRPHGHARRRRRRADLDAAAPPASYRRGQDGSLRATARRRRSTPAPIRDATVDAGPVLVLRRARGRRRPAASPRACPRPRRASASRDVFAPATPPGWPRSPPAACGRLLEPVGRAGPRGLPRLPRERRRARALAECPRARRATATRRPRRRAYTYTVTAVDKDGNESAPSPGARRAPVKYYRVETPTGPAWAREDGAGLRLLPARPGPSTSAAETLVPTRRACWRPSRRARSSPSASTTATTRRSAASRCPRSR